MAATDTDNRFERLLQRLSPGSALLRAWPLIGGVSAQVTALEVVHGTGVSERLVVRRHGAVDLAHNPQIAAHEFALLQQLHAAGLPVPKPLSLDTSCEIFPEPLLVLEYIEGTAGCPFNPKADPLDPFVTYLAQIHALDLATLDVSFLPRQDDKVAAKLRALQNTMDEPNEEARQISEALRGIGSRRQRPNSDALLHGDYWWGNTLWQAGDLVAIIDWENAVLGDPLADLANSRLEILWTLGQTGLEQFTQRYHSLAPHIDLTDLPFWDLLTALRPAQNLGAWGLDPLTEQTMRATLQQFIAQAGIQLSHL